VEEKFSINESFLKKNEICANPNPPICD